MMRAQLDKLYISYVIFFSHGHTPRQTTTSVTKSNNQTRKKTNDLLSWLWLSWNLKIETNVRLILLFSPTSYTFVVYFLLIFVTSVVAIEFLCSQRLHYQNLNAWLTHSHTHTQALIHHHRHHQHHYTRTNNYHFDKSMNQTHTLIHI